MASFTFCWSTSYEFARKKAHYSDHRLVYHSQAVLPDFCDISLEQSIGDDRCLFNLPSSDDLRSPVPISQPSRWENQPQDKNLLNSSIADQRILLFDNDDDTLNLLAEALREQGAMVEVARSVREAIEVLDRFQADVIVSDWAMPEYSGYSLIQAIRARETGERKLAQAIALTALVCIEDRARALSGGFNMFLPKPVQPNELISAIGNLTASD